jgi:short-subunit dehydrogenase
MATAVITGSSKGFGLELAKEFLRRGYCVVLSGNKQENLDKAVHKLSQYAANILAVQCDVRKAEELKELWNKAVEKWGQVDIWINNAGVGQKANKLWESSVDEARNVFDTNMMGTLYGTQIAVKGMLQQGFGKVYNTVGFGSTGMIRKGLNLYGTSKLAIAHLSKAFAVELKGSGVIVGTLQPGMMVTDFVKDTEGSSYDTADVHWIYNILGDMPDIPAKKLVKRMIDNKKNGALLTMLSTTKIGYRFLRSIFVKRDLFAPQ